MDAERFGVSQLHQLRGRVGRGSVPGLCLLVTEARMPTYLAGDPTRDAVQLYRWSLVAPLTTLKPTVVEHTVAGWVSDGHARVPGLDPVG